MRSIVEFSIDYQRNPASSIWTSRILRHFSQILQTKMLLLWTWHQGHLKHCLQVLKKPVKPSPVRLFHYMSL
jgi:hypothetical protein